MNDNINAFIGGIPTFLISVIVVFVMLGLLIGAIVILGKIVSTITNHKKAEPIVEKAAVTAAEEVAVTIEDKSQDDLELIAVITAVIAASMGTTSDQLQVRSLRKVQRKAL